MSTRVCYFIQSHRDADQIHRLVHVLHAGSRESCVVVQHNPVGEALEWSPSQSLSRAHLFAPCARQVRSHFSCQIQPYLDLIDWLEQEGIEYDWLVNLSAQDYPVKPVAEIEEFLATSTHDAYIRHWDVLAGTGPWSSRKARARYWYRYRLFPSGTEPLLRGLRLVTRFLPLHFYLDYGAWVGVRRWSTPFRDGFRCYGGWAWFSLRRKAAQFFRQYLREHVPFETHYRSTKVPEESIVQTVLANSGAFDLVNDDLRYIDYTNAHRGSPRVLTVADLPMLAAGNFHFARKFDYGVDREVLDRIDTELLRLS